MRSSCGGPLSSTSTRGAASYASSRRSSPSRTCSTAIRRRADADSDHRVAARGARRRADRPAVRQALILLAALTVAPVVEAAQAPGDVIPFAFDGPPAPIAPRSSRATPRAAPRCARPLTSPLRIDGALDEALYERCRRCPVSSRSSRAPARPPPRQTEIWIASTTTTSTSRYAAGTAQPERLRRDRDAARQQRHLQRQRHHRCACSTPSTTGATASSFTINPIGGRHDGQVTQRAAVQRRLQPGLGRRRPAGSTAAGSLEIGDAVQVAPLPAGPGADLGRQRAAQERAGRTRCRF